MSDHINRVIEEKAALDMKIAKLNLFIKTDTFKDLPAHERNLLLEQNQVMRQYSAILAIRITG